MKVFEQNKGYEHRCYVDWFWDKPHTELEVDGILYNLFLGCASTISEAAQRAKATQNIGRPYVRFEVGLTLAEYSALKESIGNKKTKISTCSGSVADLLNRVANCNIPLWQSLSTTGLALHLLQTATSPESRISSVEIVQSNERNAVDENELEEISDESDDELDAPRNIDMIIAEGRLSDCCQVSRWIFCAFLFSLVFGSLCVLVGDAIIGCVE